RFLGPIHLAALFAASVASTSGHSSERPDTRKLRTPCQPLSSTICGCGNKPHGATFCRMFHCGFARFCGDCTTWCDLTVCAAKYRIANVLTQRVQATLL